MKYITYIKEAVRPGGTPKRYLVWVSIVLIAQAIASVVPSPTFYAQGLNLSHLVLIFSIIIGVGVQLFRKDQHKIIAAYCLYVVGLILSTITISAGITSLSGIIFMLTWSLTLFVAERREYISFDLVTLFMVLMLASTIVLLMFNPTMNVADNIIILATGATLTGINIYLVYIDHYHEKNFYQESRKTYADLEKLSRKMSEILSSEGELDHLLRKVTQECVPLLHLEDCVIYLYRPERDRLVQAAAYGDKTNSDQDVINPMEIRPGEGIVGKCFTTATSILVEETRNHPDYIVDDQMRNSELAVPILSNGIAIGVLDSEHMIKGYFKERHIQAFQIISSFCGIKITEYNARESIELARIAKEESEKFKALDEVKNKFITNVSHDLKTPLSLIMAPAMQIAQISENAQVKKHSNYILKNAEHLLKVVNQLLQLNRVDKGLNELYLVELNLEKLFDKIKTQYGGLADREQIEFTVDVVPVSIMTDAFRLEQILHNLVHNAFRYTGKGGKVRLSAQRDGDLLKIGVSDNGPGIPAALQNKVFDRFFKADVNNHEGTGIGLSLVKEYVESLRGTVSLSSKEGQGTSFDVTLPMVLADDPEGAKLDLEVDEELIDSTKPVMLVVEDHADLNNFICTFFEHEFHCISAFDGREALVKIKEQEPSIIISDLMMPNMSGNEFVSQLKSSDRFGHIPIVVLSAKQKTDSKIDLYELGADNYLVKPFDIMELKAVVQGLLEQRKKLKDIFREEILHQIKIPVAQGLEVDSQIDTSQQLLMDAVDFVLENLDNTGLTIKMLTEELGIGRNKFQAEIKRLTQLTPVEFVRSIRLNEAKKLLKMDDLNVSEVAYATGFNNLSYFTRSFKSEFDILPSEYQ